MKLPLAGCFLLLSSPLFGGHAGAQALDRQAERAVRPAVVSSRVVPAPLRLFESIPISTHSDDARKSVELAIDKYENGLLDDAIVHAQHSTEKDGKSPVGYAVLSFVC